MQVFTKDYLSLSHVVTSLRCSTAYTSTPSCRVPCLRRPSCTPVDTLQPHRPPSAKFRQESSELCFFTFRLPLLLRPWWCSSSSSSATNIVAARTEEHLHRKSSLTYKKTCMEKWSPTTIVDSNESLHYTTPPHH